MSVLFQVGLLKLISLLSMVFLSNSLLHWSLAIGSFRHSSLVDLQKSYDDLSGLCSKIPCPCSLLSYFCRQEEICSLRLRWLLNQQWQFGHCDEEWSIHFPSFGLSRNMNFYHLEWNYYTTLTLESVASMMVLSLTCQTNWLPLLLPPPPRSDDTPPLPNQLGMTIYIWSHHIWTRVNAPGSPNQGRVRAHSYRLR